MTKARANAFSGHRGLTLIELMVTFAIIAIVATAAAMSVAGISQSEISASAGKIVGAMRYLRHLAVVENRPYRLVIDMSGTDEKGEPVTAWWGEGLESTDPCVRYLPEHTEEGRERQKKIKEKLQALAMDEEEAEEIASEELSSAFAQQKSSILKPRTLPKSVAVTGVMTIHHPEPQVDGVASIHFFPQGNTERAYIWFGEATDDDEEPVPDLTVEVEGLMGRIRRHPEVLDEGTFKRELEEL